jgi:hypothetical protein
MQMSALHIRLEVAILNSPAPGLSRPADIMHNPTRQATARLISHRSIELTKELGELIHVTCSVRVLRLNLPKQFIHGLLHLCHATGIRARDAGFGAVRCCSIERKISVSVCFCTIHVVVQHLTATSLAFGVIIKARGCVDAELRSRCSKPPAKQNSTSHSLFRAY